MKSIEKLVNNIFDNSKIPFQLHVDDYGTYATPFFDKSQNCLTKNFRFENTKCCINVNAAFSSILDLMIFCIKDKLKEALLQKKTILISLLDGREVSSDTIEYFKLDSSEQLYLVNIHSEINIENIFLCIKECYEESEVEVINYKDSVIMIGSLEDPAEHMRSIKETIDNNYGGKYYISYKIIKDINELNCTYKETTVKILLAKKYNMTEWIFDENSLIIEGIIDSVSEEVKEDIFNRFDKGFSELDNEMIKTIDIFFKCGLNLSEAAKKLYIHRNTLIYRLDKIQKCISYDIREFNNAVLFKIVFLLWKEKSIENVYRVGYNYNGNDTDTH